MILHVYDWLELPSANPAEADAREWLDMFCRPADEKDRAWLGRYRVSVVWKGRRWICSGASAMGDVWIRDRNSAATYDHRVDVRELSGWRRVMAPRRSGS